jgi:hypothetical protein
MPDGHIVYLSDHVWWRRYDTANVSKLADFLLGHGIVESSRKSRFCQSIIQSWREGFTMLEVMGDFDQKKPEGILTATWSGGN